MENTDPQSVTSIQKELEDYKEVLTKAMQALGEKISEVESQSKAEPKGED